jgi:hypothetical protein
VYLSTQYVLSNFLDISSSRVARTSRRTQSRCAIISAESSKYTSCFCVLRPRNFMAANLRLPQSRSRILGRYLLSIAAPKLHAGPPPNEYVGVVPGTQRRQPIPGSPSQSFVSHIAVHSLYIFNTENIIHLNPILSNHRYGSIVLDVQHISVSLLKCVFCFFCFFNSI